MVARGTPVNATDLGDGVACPGRATVGGSA